MLAAVFNGDPAGLGPGDEQTRNRHGLNFRIADSPFVMAEAHLRTNHRKEDTRLARTIKVDGWTHFGMFDDQRYANDGTLLANPAGSGEPAARSGNFGVYAVVEQQIYRPKGGDAESGISLFGRLSFSPIDRNPISFFADVGVVFAGMFLSRPDDKFGASILNARISDGVRAYDRDQIAFPGIPGTVHDYEMNLEVHLQRANRPRLDGSADVRLRVAPQRRRLAQCAGDWRQIIMALLKIAQSTRSPDIAEAVAYVLLRLT